MCDVLRRQKEPRLRQYVFGRAAATHRYSVGIIVKIMHVFRFFENLLEPTAVPTGTTPPAGLGAFYWHYARQARHLVAALFVAGFIVAILDTTIPVFIGRVVTLVSAHAPGSLLHDNWPQLVGMALVLLVARPAALLLQNLITNQGIIPGFSNLIRWQSHWHVVRQSWAFFQNDFAGRIAQRVMQTGPSLRESVVSATNAVWYIFVYGGGAIALMASNDVRLAVPVLLWFAGYAALLRYFVPRLRTRSRRMSETRSALTGRVVDSYTNIQTVKLFARPRDEDEFVRAAMDDLTEAFREQLRLTTTLGLTLATLNASLVVGTAVIAIWLWNDRPYPGRHRRDGVAADLAHRSNRRLGGAERDDDLREYRRRAGGHALDRGAAPAAGPARCGRLAGRARGGAVRRRALRLWHRKRRPARYRPRRRAGRAGRSGRTVGRRQIDPRQPLAALLRPRTRPDSDRRAGHRDRDTGKPARPDRDGDAGHFALAPIDPRQHPLRPAAGERVGGAARRGPGSCSRIRRGARRLVSGAAASTRMSASAASSCRAASASASRSLG